MKDKDWFGLGICMFLVGLVIGGLAITFLESFKDCPIQICNADVSTIKLQECPEPTWDCPSIPEKDCKSVVSGVFKDVEDYKEMIK